MSQTVENATSPSVVAQAMAGEYPEPSLDTARDFLLALRGTEEAEFTCLGEGQPIIMRGKISELWGRIERLNSAGYGIYHTVAQTVGKRCKENVSALRYIWVDADAKAFYGPEYAEDHAAMLAGQSSAVTRWSVKWPAAMRRALAAMKEINVLAPFSFVVRSGHGFHGYIKTGEMTTLEEFARAERIMRAISLKFGTDSAVANRAQLMRLPGSLNTKGPRSDWLLAKFQAYPDEAVLTLDELAERFGEEGPKLSVVAGTSVLDQMPDYIKAEIARVDGPVNQELSGVVAVPTGEDLRRVLAHINPDIEYPEWRKVICAIKATLNGSQESREITIEWSHGDLIAPEHLSAFTAIKFSGEDAVEVKWEGCASITQPGHTTMGYLVHLARKNGFTGHVEAAEAVSATSLLDRLTTPANGPANALSGALPVPVSGFGAVAPVESPSVYSRLFKSAAELLEEQTAPNWLIHGVIERGTLCMMFGPSGAGKTFAALDMAACVATGRSWHGHAVTACKALYLAGEGRRGITRRLKAWGIARGVDIASVDLSVSTAAIPFDREGAELLRQVLAEMPVHPGLVVVDTLARHLIGDENSQKDAAAFVQVCDQISQQSGASVLVIHHTGHQEQSRARGSSVLRAAVDTELSIVPQGDGRTYQLRSTKSKDAEPMLPLEFELRTVELGITDATGRQVTSAVPHCRGQVIPKVPGRPLDDAAVELVRQHPGLTLTALRPFWAATGKAPKELKRKLEAAQQRSQLRCDSDIWTLA